MALPSNITQAGEKARQAQEQAGIFTAALPTIGDVLGKKVNTLFEENQDILNQFNPAVTDLATARGKSFELFSNITDPFEREFLASEFVKTQSLPALTLAGQLGQRMGNISDIVDAGTNAFTAQTQQIANAAESARQTYLDLLDEFKTMEDIRLRQEAINASRASSGPGFAERQSGEIQALIAEAGKLPENQRKAFIIANGYNPDGGEFTGLFARQITTADRIEQAELLQLNTQNAAASAAVNKPDNSVLAQFRALPEYLGSFF